jgi:hypothetical protein
MDDHEAGVREGGNGIGVTTGENQTRWQGRNTNSCTQKKQHKFKVSMYRDHENFGLTGRYTKGKYLRHLEDVPLKCQRAERMLCLLGAIYHSRY